ncbi:MAG: hypothetical protein HYW85_01470, partial [Deltaproteobacteria bacterium]|nr:hypothetical protein [Deltaproteobacteria bacterium]
ARNSKKPFPFELFSKAYAAQLPLQPNQPIRQLKVRLPNEAEIQNQIETILLLGSDEEKKKLFISAFEFTLGAEARSPYVQAFKQLVLAKMEQNRHVSTFDMGILKICSQGYLPAQVLKDVFFMDKETLEPADELFLRFAAGFLYEPDDPLREELDTLEGRQRVAQHSWQAMCDVYHYFSSFINFCKDNQCESWGGFKDTFLQMFFAYRNYLLLPPVERNSVSQFIRDLRTAIHQRAAQDPNYLRISEDPDVTKSRLVTFSFLLSDIFLIGMDHLTGLAATHQEYQNMSRNPLLSERELHTRLAMTNLEILLSPPVFIPATNAVVSVVRYNVLLGRQAVMAGRASVTAENVEISWLQETQAYINQNPQWRALQGQIPELSVDQLLAEGSARNILQEAATQRVVVATGVRAASLAADITRTTGLVEGQSAMSALSRVREFLVKLRITRLYTASTVDAPADLAGRFVPGSVTAHSRIAINEFGLNKQVLFDNIMSLKYNVRFGSMRYGRQLYDPFVASSGSAATAEQVRFTLFARSSLKESTQWIYPFPETAKAEIHAFLQGENFQATINWNQFLATLEKHGVITSRDRFAYLLQLFTEAHEGKHFFIYAQDFKPFVMRELNILKQSGHAIEEVLQMVEVELAKRGTFSVRAKVLAKIIEMKRGITLTEAQIRQVELICHHAEEKAALQVEAQLAKNLIEADDGLVQGLFQMEGGRARLAAPLRRLLAEDTVLSNPTPLESFTHNTRLLWELLEEAPPAAGSGFDGLFFGTVGQGQIAPDIGLFHGAVDVSAMPNIYEQIINNFAR